MNIKPPILTGEKGNQFIQNAANPKPVKITDQQYRIYQQLIAFYKKKNDE